MSCTRIVLCSLLVPLALFAQPAPDTLWTRVIWDAPGAQAQAVVQVDGGFVVASNRGQEVHLCMVDDSGSVVWSRWYGTELRGTLSCYQVAARSDGCLLLTTMGDSNRVICVDPSGSIRWRRSCGRTNRSWDGVVEWQGSAIAPLLPGGHVAARREHWYTHTGGNGNTTYIDGYDSSCAWDGLSGGAPYNWYSCFLLIRDHWWAYVSGGDTSIRVRTPDFQQDYSVRWSARWLERAYGTPCPSGGLYLLGTMYSDSNAILGISATGEVIWSQSVVMENADFRDISAVPDSGCVVAGTLLSSTNGDRALLVRLGTRGEVLWIGVYGTLADEFITDAVFCTRSGGFVLVGEVNQDGTAYPYIIHTRPDAAYWYAEITDFVATSCDSGVEITFSAPTELNVDRYELLRSVGGSYRAVSTIPAGGTPVGHRQYRWVDHLAGGLLRYSLADIGRNGLRREHPNLIASIDRVPTQILDFTAREDSGRVLMMMRTAFEYGVDHYVLQRHRGPETISVAVVPSHGASFEGSSYKAEDRGYQGSYVFVYYPVAVDSSGMAWSFVESADTIQTHNPPSPPPGPDVVLDYTLSAFPNPFNASTTLYFATSRTEKVRIDIYDLVGRFVATAVNQEYAPGGWRVPFDATGLPSGIYFARINTAAGFTATQKLLLLR